MELVGKILKSKINGALFEVVELRTEAKRHFLNENQYYIIKDLASGKTFAKGKGWFEVGYIQNLEIVG